MDSDLKLIDLVKIQEKLHLEQSSERIVFLSSFEAEIWLSEVGSSLVPDLVKEDSCVIWFLVVFSKTNHCGLNLSIDLENSGKTTLEK